MRSDLFSNGYYKVLERLCEENSDADFSFLGNVRVTTDSNAFHFLHGLCDAFAAMLSDVYGYEIQTVRHFPEDGFDGRLIHAYCVAQAGDETAYIDIRGITTDPVLFFAEFENEVTYYPEDCELWDLEGPAVVEFWKNKNALFDGDYEGWSNEEIKSFIRSHDDIYSTKVLSRAPNLDKQIQDAAARTNPFLPISFVPETVSKPVILPISGR